MNYLERNAQIIAEVGRSLRLTRGEIVGWSKRTKVTVLGSYRSELLENQLYIALKETRGVRTPKDKVIEDLAFVSVVADQIPELKPELPLFLGLLRNKNGQDLGTLTEDFSEGKKYRLWEVQEFDLTNQGLLPERLRQFVGGKRSLMESEELATMFFKVGTVGNIVARRLGDFDKSRLHLSLDEREEKFPQKHIERDLGLYTITVDYDV